MNAMTSETFDAIQSLIEQAVEDQQNYEDEGYPEIDYGDEWPQVARTKAAQNRLAADWLEANGGMGPLAQLLRAMAHGLERSANEFRNPEADN